MDMPLYFSAAVGNASTISSIFEWEISNFRSYCEEDNVHRNAVLTSPKFVTYLGREDMKWYLHMYINRRKKDLDHLSLYAFISGQCNLEAAITFIIFNKEGRKMINYTVNEQVHKERRYDHDAYGRAEKFVSLDFILNPANGILDNDTLKIVCEIVYYKQTNNRELIKVNECNLPQQEVIEKYETLLEDSKFSDVSLIAEGKELKVHKCILAKSSSVFAAMFDSEMKEKQDNTVDITDIKYDVLAEMIRFIYAGKVYNMDTLAGELAVAADKYALDTLKNMCEKAMRKNLSPDNVISCIQLAESLHMDSLKESAIEFMAKNVSDISERPDAEFNSLSHDILREVLRCLAGSKK